MGNLALVIPLDRVGACSKVPLCSLDFFGWQRYLAKSIAQHKAGKATRRELADPE